MVIDGKKIAQSIYARCAPIQGARYLAIIVSNPTPATQSFILQKKTAAQKLGIEVRHMESMEEAMQDDLCGGIVLQMPLAKGVDTEAQIAKIPPRLDVDNLTGKAPLPAPAIAVVQEIIAQTKFPQSLAIIGKGRLVGKPLMQWAQSAGIKDVAVYDVGFDPNDLKSADMIISGAGSPHIFSSQHLKKNAIVIDFGYGKGADGKLQGDFDPSNGDPLQYTYTPTPGGTGPILVACLMRNFCQLQKMQKNNQPHHE